MAEILDVVNKNDEIIGQAPRDEVHQKGLICRIVYVWFYIPDKKVILQRRSKMKKNHPGRLTTAVSGHVESGQTYTQAAVKETFEETGLQLDASELKSGGVVHVRYDDEASDGYISDAMRASFLYLFTGDIADLKVEVGEGAGFEVRGVNELLSPLVSDPLVPFISSEHGRKILEKIREL